MAGSLATLTPADATPDTTLSGMESSIYQTNAKVAALAVGGGVLYAGGQFTGVKPPGSTTTTARTYLAAFNASTGVVTSFNPTLNGKVNAVALSADNSTLYIAGAFTTVNGTTRNRFAALSTSTGALTSWNPNANGSGYAVLPANGHVYIGGTFTKLGTTSRSMLASTTTSTGALEPAFTATTDGEVSALVATTDGSNRLIVGGVFDTISGAAHHGLASLDPTTGANQAWAGDDVLPNVAGDPNDPFSGCTAEAGGVLYSAGVVYVGGEGEQPGCFDGDFAVTTGGTSGGAGTVQWINPCEGATAALAMINGVLYKGSHMHDCAYNQGGAGGGFTGSFDRSNRSAYHLIAQDPSDGSFQHWYPNVQQGAPAYLGPFAMATDGSQLFVGGDFVSVNGTTQQGLARFRPLSASSSQAPTKPSVAPTAAVTGASKVTVKVPSDWDPDNGTLTYRLYRGTTLLGTQTAESWPWAGPTLKFAVTVPSPSVAYTFRYTVSDGTTTSAYSPASASVTASAANSPGAYSTVVSGQSPNPWYQLNNSASDATANHNDASLQGGASYSSTGATTGNGSVTLDGSTGYLASTSASPLTTSYSESVWFKGTSLSGGDLVGRSTTKTGADTSADRAIWLDDDGQVAFAMHTVTDPNAPPGPPNATVRSAGTYNDGSWHQAVATYDGTTMSLYVDGALASSQAATAASTTGSFFYRAGYTDLSQLAAVFGTNSTTDTAPNSYFFKGSIDEVSFYGNALTAAQVQSQWAAGQN